MASETEQTDPVEQQTFWYFSDAECYVPSNISDVPALDKFNKIYKNGYRTEEYTENRLLTTNQYRETYCEKDVTNRWIYVDNDRKPIIQTHWYYEDADCYVPISIKGIPALSKCNTASPYGTTELYSNLTDPYYTIDEYHSSFCTFSSEDNHWYYTKTV